MANIVKYTDQKWTEPAVVAGETLSVNGHYTGEHLGTAMQDKMHTAVNNDPHCVEHGIVRYGTMMQDKASNANMPVVAGE